MSAQTVAVPGSTPAPSRNGASPHASQEIPLSRPDITQREIDLVVETMRSGRLALGPMAERFERAIADRAGRRYGIAVSNGTCGLHMALLALGIGPGDEVITTPFSFVASANCILYVGAKPVFVDIDPVSLNLDPARLEAAITPRTKAIIAVEAFGNPAHMPEYEVIAARRGIPIVEDCCEALGSTIDGRPAGSFGRIGVFAFYPNKQITTGEGGCIVTDDRQIAQMCRSLRNQGRVIVDEPGSSGGSSTGTAAPSAGTWLSHERLGFNYRLDEMSAALGCGQLGRFNEIMAWRELTARLYMNRLAGFDELTLPVMPAAGGGSVMSWFVFVVRLAARFGRDERDRIIMGLRARGIGASDYFPCIHLQPFYRERFGFKQGQFPISESVSERTIALPFFGGLTGAEVDVVARNLKELMGAV